jgi:hypothetical protein
MHLRNRRLKCEVQEVSTHSPPLDTCEQEFSYAVVLQDWVRAPNYRTVRINIPGVSARTGNGVRFHRVAQVLGLT